MRGEEAAEGGDEVDVRRVRDGLRQRLNLLRAVEKPDVALWKKNER